MDNNYVVIDEKNWKRATHCAVFRNSVEPAFCITFELDITDFLQMTREKNYSFTMALVYLVSKCANEIEEFRYRFLNGEVVLYDRINTAFTYMEPEAELFKVVNVPMADTMAEYVTMASRTAAAQKEYFTGPLGNDVFQFSPMPWVTYTHISHTNSGKKDNATPLFDWGKYYEKDGRVFLPFSVQAHHSFVDGVHIGRLAKKLQDNLKENNTIARELGSGEIEAAVALCWKVFLQYEAPEYSKEGVDEFYRCIHDEAYLSRLVWYGAFVGEKLAGTIAMRNAGAHVALFFVDSHYHRQGIGKLLFRLATAEHKFDKITVNASPYAFRVYEHLGFRAVDTEQVTDGLRYIPMQTYDLQAKGM